MAGDTASALHTSRLIRSDTGNQLGGDNSEISSLESGLLPSTLSPQQSVSPSCRSQPGGGARVFSRLTSSRSGRGADGRHWLRAAPGPYRVALQALSALLLAATALYGLSGPTQALALLLAAAVAGLATLGALNKQPAPQMLLLHFIAALVVLLACLALAAQVRALRHQLRRSHRSHNLRHLSAQTQSQLALS